MAAKPNTLFTTWDLSLPVFVLMIGHITQGF